MATPNGDEGVGFQVNNQIPVRSRRSKGKSRGGCVGCKQRKVKCDESHPACSRCKGNSRTCVYENIVLPKWKDKAGVLVLPTASPPGSNFSTPLINKIEVVGLSSQPAQYTLPDFKSSFNVIGDYQFSRYQPSTMPLDDLGAFRSEDTLLLTHFVAKTSFDLIASRDLWMEQVIGLAFQNNFLMHAILALSARHIRHLHGSSASSIYANLQPIEIHHHQQTLSTYQNAFRDNTVRMNQDAVLGTSLLLCFYSSSLIEYQPAISVFAEDTTFTFFRGIRSIVSDAPDIAHNGLFRCIVTPPLFLKHLHPAIGPGAKLLNLLNTIQFTPSISANKQIYIERIESLTLYFSTSTIQNPEPGAFHELLLCFLRWQSFCSMEFVDLVKVYDPVALIILAHYYAAAGLVLSRAGNIFWWWHKKPAYMVRTISDYLGPEWDAWMEWPISMVARYGHGKLLEYTDENGCKLWSSALDPADSSAFPDLYNWEQLKSYSRSSRSPSVEVPGRTFRDGGDCCG